MRTTATAALVLATSLALTGCAPEEQASNAPPAPGTPPPPTPGEPEPPLPRVLRNHVYAVKVTDTSPETLHLAVSDRAYGNPQRGWTFLGAPVSVQGEPSPTVVPLTDPRLRGAGFVHCGEVSSVPLGGIRRDLGALNPTDSQRVNAGLDLAMGLGTPTTPP